MATHSNISYKCWTWLYITSFCLVWWLVFSLARHYLDGADMVENFAWGQEWQWGNNKHPPLFGWITATWFEVFPASDWAYYLLNELNLGIALFLLALAMGRLLSPEKVLAGIILTSLCSHFGPDSGYKYNANTAQLPFIAGFAWSMIRATTSRRSLWFIIAGLFGGAALLTKYYALVIFLAIGLSLLISLRPPLLPWLNGLVVTSLTTTLLVTPHLIWSFQHGWPSLNYMHAAHETLDKTTGVDAYVIAITGVILFCALPLLVWTGSLIRMPATPSAGVIRPRFGLIALIFSVALTLLAALTQGINPVSSWFIPALLFMGWALIDMTPGKFSPIILAKRSMYVGSVYLIATIAVGVWWGLRYRAFPAPPPYALPQTLAADITRMYHDMYGRPVEFAVGSFPLPYVLSFYSPDHPHGAYGLDLDQSPWIDRTVLKKGNLVAVCGSFRFGDPVDSNCITVARQLFGPEDRDKKLGYAVYDPKTRRMGRQVFDVLFWTPSIQQ